MLLGGQVLSRDELLRRLDAVTLDEVRAAAREIRDGLLIKVPAGTSAEWGGYAQAPLVSLSQVEGETYPTLDSGHADLVMGTSGVSVVTSDGPITVRFDDVTAALAWPDGAVRLIGRDGFAFTIEPTLYDFPPTLMSWLADRLPDPALITMPARDPDAIPAPPPPPEPTKRGLLRRRRA